MKIVVKESDRSVLVQGPAHMLSSVPHMSALPGEPADFARRSGGGRGTAYLEACQARALAGSLAAGASRLSLPESLAPFPLITRPRSGLVRAARGAALILLLLQLCYMAMTSMLIAVYKFTDPSVTVLMAFRAWDYHWKLERPRPLPLRHVPVYVRSMLIAIEDDKFYQHHGIDLEAFERAHEINKRLGKPLYGGSTLTMQVARTLFLVPVKSYLRKYLEVLTAFELELLLSKNRILELYLGYAEWGRGVFGIEAASRHWFGAGVGSISREDAARLVALLSSPIRYGPDTLMHSGILRERYDYLDRHFVNRPGPADLNAAAAVAGGEAGGSGQTSAAPGTAASQPAIPSGQASSAGSSAGSAPAGFASDVPPPSMEPDADSGP
ncbi:MAG TPA: biosynthetic peptidoglycan transglycosylase [Rectinemataceae bacterium]|nr:biosynthetic peptidoglycan transglycosylase [Rectinemataceae bacterium]